MNTIKFHIRQVVKVLIYTSMIIDLTSATEQNLNLSIKDFSKIERIYIDKSILLNKQYFGLEKACKGWKFNEKSLKEFFKISQKYEDWQTSYRIFDQIPCVIRGRFSLDNIDYFFEINAGGSFEIWNNNYKFYFGCDNKQNKKCDIFLLD
ncbi:hypothetical protein H2279_08375 [Campylobacter sp. B0100352/1]|uniref:hypothetical protein n=1 Tax=Campylobacter sp. B0100352/1 TaxID=2735783 RepID=UPI001DB757EC|nr:hypothetical protein [Campylobacter sp. B0100352/1]